MVLLRNVYASFSLLSCALIALALFAVTSAACQAPESVMQGAQGEFCNNSNGDCQSGLRCENNICTAGSGGGSGDECATICDRLDDCQASLSNCEAACRNETTNWASDIVDAFERCFTDDFSCEDLRAEDDPAQACYNELPAIDADRERRCDEFHRAGDSCQADDESLRDLRNACRKAARTLNEETWAHSESCVERLEDNHCPDIVDCLNQVFDLSPAMTTPGNGVVGSDGDAPSADGDGDQSHDDLEDFENSDSNQWNNGM